MNEEDDFATYDDDGDYNYGPCIRR